MWLPGTRPASAPRRWPPRLGYDSIGRYLHERRAAGWTWRAMAAEAGQPESWLRRQAARNAGGQAARNTGAGAPGAPGPARGQAADPAPALRPAYSWVVTALTSV